MRHAPTDHGREGSLPNLSVIDSEISRSVRADRHEPRMADRELTRETRDQVKGHSKDHVDSGEHRNARVIRRRAEAEQSLIAHEGVHGKQHDSYDDGD